MDRKDYKYIYNSLNKNGSDRNFNYPIYIRNKEVATQEWVGKVIEGNIGANYLTKTEANTLLSSKSDKDHTHKEYLTDVAMAVTTGSKTVGGNASTTGLYDGERYVYSLSGTENIGLGVNFRSWHPGEDTESMDCSYDSSTGILSWTLTTLVKGGPVSGSIKWSGNNDTIKTTKNGTENVVGYFNRINGKSIVSTTGSTDFEFYTNEEIDEKLRWKANKSDIPTKTSQLTNDSGYITSYTDTKNTAGSTDTSSKIFLIGATSQLTNPQTYSHDTAYVGTDGCLYSNNTKVSVEGHTHSQYLTSQNTYTKEEINTKLNGKSDVGHTHSEYLTANDIANKADKGTKLSDYGIIDAYTKQDADLRFVPGISGDENNDLRGLIYNTGSTVGMEYIASNQNKEFGSIHMEDATGSDPFYIELKTANNHYDLAKQESELIVASDQAGIRCSNNENNQYSTVGAGLFDPNDENNTHNNSCAYLSATDGEISKFLTVTPTSAAINNEEIATQTWVQNQLGDFTVDAYTKDEVDTRLSGKANLSHQHTSNEVSYESKPLTIVLDNLDNRINLHDHSSDKVHYKSETLTSVIDNINENKANLSGGNTFNGLQTINAPTNTSGSEQTTVKIKTANGGAIVLGKEGQNSGTMIRLDQSDGTCRLRFRSSATAGAMVWEQPEQGAQLYIDLGKNGADKRRIQFPSSAGTLALKSQINNGTLTIQKNGTNVQTFTANQSGNVTANITVPTKVSELTNDSGFLTSHQDISGKADKADTLAGYGITDAYTKTEVDSKLSGKLPIVGAASSGETKLYNRYAQKGYSGGGSTYWYYRIATLPVYNSAGNYASLIITGRIGGWEAGNMSSINALVFNRGAEGIVAIDLAKTSSSTAYNICDIVCYREADGKTSVYLKCAGYFTFDINVESYQSDIVLPTSVSKLTSVTGTEQVKLSTTTSRLEVYNGNAYVSGTRLVKSNESLKNPYSLIIGGKAYDGSSSKTITAEDLGITSGDGGITSIYVIDLTSGTVLALGGGQVNVNGYVLTMVYSGMNTQDQTMTISLNQGDTEALVAVVNNDTDEIVVESCYGSVYEFTPDTVSEWQNYHVEVFDYPDYNDLQHIDSFNDIEIFRSNFTSVCSIKLNEAGTQWIIY